ncbi:hypothetical protein TNIN_426381 [Trichonephila inaurata madagascariensis]|uniref:Uncharacterized protein n=1 Tax=Trichonephila inaurata madagascariensis TaxID=2747483 RepID=A0A8X6WNT8_9ARAC|nr:hypothetical protein TNIN_426381 [Trichonephila inaurata madagascariensis]
MNSCLASVFEIHHDLKVESAIVFLPTAAARGRGTRLAETARLTGGRTDRTWRRKRLVFEEFGCCRKRTWILVTYAFLKHGTVIETDRSSWRAFSVLRNWQKSELNK